VARGGKKEHPDFEFAISNALYKKSNPLVIDGMNTELLNNYTKDVKTVKHLTTEEGATLLDDLITYYNLLKYYLLDYR
jgi:hypothetical protein